MISEPLPPLGTDARRREIKRRKDRRHYQKYRARYCAQAKKYRLAHPEKMRALKRKWNAENREKYLAAKRKWQQSHKAAGRGPSRRWYHRRKYASKLLTVLAVAGQIGKINYEKRTEN